MIVPKGQIVNNNNRAYAHCKKLSILNMKSLHLNLFIVMEKNEKQLVVMLDRGTMTESIINQKMMYQSQK